MIFKFKFKHLLSLKGVRFQPIIQGGGPAASDSFKIKLM